MQILPTSNLLWYLGQMGSADVARPGFSTNQGPCYGPPNSRMPNTRTPKSWTPNLKELPSEVSCRRLSQEVRFTMGCLRACRGLAILGTLPKGFRMLQGSGCSTIQDALGVVSWLSQRQLGLQMLRFLHGFCAIPPLRILRYHGGAVV